MRLHWSDRGSGEGISLDLPAIARLIISEYHFNVFWAIVRKTVRPMLSDSCHVYPVLSVTLVCCGQTVGWIKMPLGMEVGVGSGHTVLDGDLALPPPPEKRSTAVPTFRPMFIVVKRLDGSRCHLVRR